MEAIDQLIEEKNLTEDRKRILQAADFIVVPLSKPEGEFVNKGTIELYKNAKLNGFKAEYLCQDPSRLRTYEHYSDLYVIGTLLVTNIQVLKWLYKLLKSKDIEKYLGSIPVFRKLIYGGNELTEKDANELLRKIEDIIEKRK